MQLEPPEIFANFDLFAAGYSDETNFLYEEYLTRPDPPSKNKDGHRNTTEAWTKYYFAMLPPEWLNPICDLSAQIVKRVGDQRGFIDHAEAFQSVHARHFQPALRMVGFYRVSGGSFWRNSSSTTKIEMEPF